MKTAWQIIAGVLSVLFPVLWFFGRDQGWLPYIAGMMVLVWAGRAIVQPDRWQRVVSAVLSLFFVLVLVLQQPWAMYWYPFFVSVLMLLLFGGSLLSKQSLIERLARIRQPELSDDAVRHTRRVTQIWCGFFVLNGAIIAALVLMEHWHAWAIYTGFISYGLMGMLAGGEWLWRRRRQAARRVS